MYIKL